MTTSHSPIFKLSDDLLYTIFIRNTELPDLPSQIGHDTRPLIITQRSAQVCQRWRNLILSSATIWGRLIDLDLLQEKSRWRKKILARSGKLAPLWITSSKAAMQSGMPLSLQDFLKRLLREQWERVEVVDIWVPDSALRALEWKVLLRPAPALQRFKCDTQYRMIVEDIIPPASLLFAGDAPFLRNFFTEWIPLGLPAPWFSHLMELRTFVPLDPLLLLRSLASMQSLERLTIVDPIIYERAVQGSLPYNKQIQLPHLRVISATTTVLTCLALAEHIFPAPGCEFSLLSLYTKPFSLRGDIPSSHSAIRRWLANYLDHSKSSVALDFQRSIGSQITVAFQSAGRRFALGLSFENGQSLEDDLPYFLSILKAFSPPSHFCRVEKLTLNIGDFGEILPHLGDFLLSLPCVKAMWTDDMTLALLSKFYGLTNGVSSPFPLLQTLIMDHEPNWLLFGSEYLRNVESYLRLRKEATGRQVETLDLSNFRRITGDMKASFRRALRDLVTELKWT